MLLSGGGPSMRRKKARRTLANCRGDLGAQLFKNRRCSLFGTQRMSEAVETRRNLWCIAVWYFFSILDQDFDITLHGIACHFAGFLDRRAVSNEPRKRRTGQGEAALRIGIENERIRPGHAADCLNHFHTNKSTIPAPFCPLD